ncbi:MAG: 3-phosphoserine/phosphohydroxythreonine transaminase [Candidatus Eisenbacteria sp.]|nr:3-phosphoserine/phosphohydroxythreonine transaminase [Candidatus Eisenbacteria bacterium]
MARAYNFFPGPAVLPIPALERAQRELLDWENTGTSVMETSHRSKEYDALHNETIGLIRELLDLPDNYHVLFLTGGASLQFAMIPMNLLSQDQTADYIHTGTWSKKAIAEAQLFGKVNIAFDGETVKLMRIPQQDELKLSPGARYVHMTSNNTIKGTQFHAFPETGNVPLLCDMSSDFMWRPFDVKQFGMIYAGAQKNVGPAGVTIAILRDDVLAQCKAENPTLLKYKTHVDKNSMFNTCPCFNIYMLRNVLAYMKEIGGLKKVEEHNRKKASIIYSTIDENPGFFRAPVAKDSRSFMNIVFRLPSEELEKKFVAGGLEQRMLGLKGHRSVGGIRISAYNSCPMEAVEKAAAYMKEFARENG